MLEKEKKTFLENIYYLSTLTKYNSERNSLVLGFFDCIIKKGTLFERKIDLKDIYLYIEREKNLAKDEKFLQKSLIEEIQYTLPTNTHYKWNLSYVSTRYSYIENPFFKRYHFYIGTLQMLEEVLRSIVISKAYSLGIGKTIYQFENEEEYSDLRCIKEPNAIYTTKWSQCISIDKATLLEITRHNSEYEIYLLSFFAASKISEKTKELQGQIEKCTLTAIDSLSMEVHEWKERKFSLFEKPIIKICKDNSSEFQLLIPFPYVLCSTIHFRIERLISECDILKKLEEASKGKIAEKVLSQLFKNIPSINYTRNFQYIIQEKKFETDVLLLLKNSLWAIEIKSHPIFKKIPYETDKVYSIFKSKVLEGFNQGIRTLEFLSTNSEILFNLNQNKKYSSLEKGVIVLLDGFLPTIMTQNKPLDDIFGITEIYNDIPEKIRIYIISFLELSIIGIQPDINNFEKFLLWRTGYRKTMPICSYDEKEYWAFYNDKYLDDKKNQDVFNEMVSRQKEQKVIMQYISYRFNNKEHLAKNPLK